MKLNITAKKMNISESFAEYAEKKLATKLDKFFGEEADAKIVLKEMKSDIIVELTVRYNNMIYRAEQVAADKRDALDADIDKIIRQIRRNKTKLEKKIKANAFDALAFDEPESEKSIVVDRHKTFIMRPMSEEEAVLQMEMLGHEFFMFRNADSGDINVVYKRRGGSYAVLVPEDE